MRKKHVTLEEMAKRPACRALANEHEKDGAKVYLLVIRSNMKINGIRVNVRHVVKASSRKHAEAKITSKGLKVYKVVRIRKMEGIEEWVKSM